MKEYFKSNARYLKLPIELPYEEMLKEARNLLGKFTAHRDSEYAHKGWASLTIHGLGWDKHESYKTYGYAKGKDASKDMIWTEIEDSCPVTTKWLKEVFPCDKYGRVRFMLLKAGGHIALHNDSSIPLLENINIALNNPEGCKWIWGDGEEFIMEQGGVYAMNIHYPHSVVNTSSEDRIHLIIARHDATAEWKSLVDQAALAQGVSGEYIVIDELP
jgi:quercetin dioxygenase-like cupin family protein